MLIICEKTSNNIIIEYFTSNDIMSKINLLTKTNSDLEKSVDKIDGFEFTFNKISKTIYEHENRISNTDI